MVYVVQDVPTFRMELKTFFSEELDEKAREILVPLDAFYGTGVSKE